MRKVLISSLVFGPLAAAHGQETPPTEDVLVTASRIPLAVAESGSAVSVITRDQLDRLQAIELADVLRNVPGIAVSRSGPLGAQTQVRLRGAEANHVLVFIDGVEANDPAIGGEFQFEHLSTETIERVEIVRGPQSALWGSDAVAGVINVTTRSAEPATPAFNGFLETGSFATQHAGGRFSSAGERHRLDLSASLVDSEGSNIARQGTEDDGYENATVNLAAGWDLSERATLDFSLRRVDSEAELDGIDFGTGLPTDADVLIDTEQGYFGTTAELIGSRLTQRFRLGYLDTEQRNWNAGAPDGSFGGTKRSLSYQAALAFGDAMAQDLIVALEREREDFFQAGVATPFGDPNQRQQIDSTAYVLEYRLAPGDATNLMVSLRHDANSDFEDIGSYRLTASHDFGGFRLRGGFGTGQKAPSFIERFGFFPDTFLGNPDLKPERSKGWELGVDKPFGASSVLRLSYFSEELENEINGFVFDPGLLQFTARNMPGESERNGVEIDISSRPSQRLELRGMYTYVDSEYPDGAGMLSPEIRRPEHVASLNVNYALEKLNVNFNLAYNGTQFDTFFPPFPAPPERQKLASYRLATLALSYALTPRLEVFGRIENLLDEDYEDVIGFNTPGRGAFVGIRSR